MKRRKTMICLIVAAVALALVLPGFYNALTVTRYTVRTPGIARSVRIALVTDLHSCAYGDGQRELLEAVQRESPDLVLMAGDIFDDDLPDDNAIAFLTEAGRRWPCYYVTGNHEYWGGEEAFYAKMDALKSANVTRLSGTAVRTEAGGGAVLLCGADDPEAWNEREESYQERQDGSFGRQLTYLARRAKDEGCFSILLTHRPEHLDMYVRRGFDLVVSGHAHGGQWRVPGLINGLWAPGQGLFPAHAGGLYRQEGTTMIVSRGLARESTAIPRWYNRPELVMIELVPADRQTDPEQRHD